MTVATFGTGYGSLDHQQDLQRHYAQHNDMMRREMEAMKQQAFMNQVGYAQPQQAVAPVAPKQNKKVLLLPPKKGK